MRTTISMLLAGAVAMSVPAFAAQDQHAAALRTILTRTAAGACPADMMQPTLLKACNEQLPKLGPALAAAGPIKSMTFVKADPSGRHTETYKVAFAKGKTMTWHIGGLKNGKFDSVYADEDI